MFIADASDVLAADSAARTHIVARGESIWRIARDYGIEPGQLLRRNGLDAGTVLHPGMVLQIDAAEPGDAPAVAN